MPACADAPRRVLTIAGVDPTAGAGLGSDLRVAAAHHCVALPLVTALTVQNRHGFRRLVATEPQLLAEMLDAALDDAPIAAIKVGLLGSTETLGVVAEVLLEDARAKDVAVVIDPVASATAGGYDASDALLRGYRALFGSRVLWTPNVAETVRLTGLADVEVAAEQIAGSDGAVLCTRGDDTSDPIEDRLWSGGVWTSFRHPRIFGLGPVHGTGCALATAVACRLASGESRESACATAIDFVADCLRATAPSSDGLPVPLCVEF